MNTLLRRNLFSIYNNTLKFSCRSLSDDTQAKIKNIVDNNKVVVFMKGTPETPRCGFSNAVVQILRMHGVAYESVDVLSDEAMRQAVKDYTKWPTIPQVFINGEFVGGCDIMLQMHQSGELIEELKKVRIQSLLSSPPLKRDELPKE